AIKSDGSLACWGNNNNGQLNGTPSGAFTQLRAGDFSACATAADGYLSCWGFFGIYNGGPPDITSSAPPDGTVGAAYSHTVISGPDTGPPATFEVTSGALPDGLSLDHSSGQITGTPTTVGTFTGEITATNGLFAPDDTQAFSIEIAKATTSLSGTASAGGDLGTALHDSAMLSGGASPTGTITFKAYGPGDATCSGAPAFTDTKPVSGNGGYDSAAFTPAGPGTYRWTASYGGDADNEASSTACNDAGQSAEINTVVDPAPQVTSLTVTPKSFSPTGKPTDLQRPAKKAKKGTTIQITLSEPALVNFRIKNAKPGKTGGPPLPPSKPRSFKRQLPAGPSTVAFSGRLAERTFKPRRYRLIARAIDSANQKSEKVSAKFRVVG
ncbi:MAG: Ig domain-containing protein, partial [Isosphaeraceae bacterium]